MIEIKTPDLATQQINDEYPDYTHRQAAKFGYELCMRDMVRFTTWVGENQYMQTVVGTWFKFGDVEGRRYSIDQLFEMFTKATHNEFKPE